MCHEVAKAQKQLHKLGQSSVGRELSEAHDGGRLSQYYMQLHIVCSCVCRPRIVIS